MKLLPASALLLLAFASPSAFAQTTVGTQTPAAGNCYPFGCNSTSSSIGQDVDYFQIYSASAFSGVTSFNTISFADSGINFSAFTSAPVSPNLLAGNYVISFSTTTAALGADYPIMPLLNIQTFFSGNLAASEDFSGFSIAGTNYSYDPSQGNLVLEVVASDQAVTPNSGANGYVQEDLSGTSTTRAFNEASGSTLSATNGLVTTFSEGAVAAVPEPGTWAMMLVGFGMIGFAARRRSNVKTAANYPEMSA